MHHLPANHLPSTPAKSKRIFQIACWKMRKRKHPFFWLGLFLTNLHQTGFCLSQPFGTSAPRSACLFSPLHSRSKASKARPRCSQARGASASRRLRLGTEPKKGQGRCGRAPWIYLGYLFFIYRPSVCGTDPFGVDSWPILFHRRFFSQKPDLFRDPGVLREFWKDSDWKEGGGVFCLVETIPGIR